MKKRVRYFAAMLLCATQGCSTIWASESYRPVADETLSLGMNREQVERVLSGVCRSKEFVMGTRSECRYEDQDSWRGRVGLYFLIAPLDWTLLWLEALIQDNNQRWASSLYDQMGELVYFKSVDRAGDSIIELGGWDTKLPKPPRHNTFYEAVFGLPYGGRAYNEEGTEE